MTVHIISQVNDKPVYDKTDAHNGDTFILTGNGAGAEIFGLTDTTLIFLGYNESATVAITAPNHGGTTTIVDAGKGTQFNFIEGSGNIAIYDFQHDKSGYIHAQMLSPITAHLTPSSDGHGGTFLTAPGLKIDLVGDAHVAASQHS